MAIRISKVKARASQFPRPLLFLEASGRSSVYICRLHTCNRAWFATGPDRKFVCELSNIFFLILLLRPRLATSPRKPQLRSNSEETS